MRKEKNFPIIDDAGLCDFLRTAWTSGWLDEYSSEHFLIKAIENRLTSFVGQEQLIENNINMTGTIEPDGTINYTVFNLNFCINFSTRMQFLAKKFGLKHMRDFMTGQMSAGKQHYRENAFFEALSEVSILSFYASRYDWSQFIYEPPIAVGGNHKNPEARFIGEFICDSEDKARTKRTVTVNVEVKSPEFPHDTHKDEKILIPTVLLTDNGRKEVKAYCANNGIKYLDPRVLKLRDFINSAADKFTVPGDDEFNLLYINWSYRDFSSNSFLEAWSLLTNEINGVLTHPEIAKSIKILPDVFKKITAVIVYTESLEGLMFSDFRHVWQSRGRGPRFRMWVIDEKLRGAGREGEDDLLFHITGMNPSSALTQMVMIDYKSKTDAEKVEASRVGIEVMELIQKQVERE